MFFVWFFYLIKKRGVSYRFRKVVVGFNSERIIFFGIIFSINVL